MTSEPLGTSEALGTRAVAQRWFRALAQGDGEAAGALLADDVEWINYTVVPGYNDAMPWIGTFHTKEKVLESFGIFLSLVEPKSEEVVRLVVEGEDAMGVIHEVSTVRETGMDFEIEFVQWLTVRGGQIVRWKSYTDPSTIIRALKG